MSPQQEAVDHKAGLHLVERQDHVGLSLDTVRALISAHGLGGDVALQGELAAASARTHQTNPETFGRLMPGCASLNSMDRALTQIDGQG